MTNDIIDWDKVPDVMSKDQFYRLCHISKTTALHLLRSGKVPCKDSGKKTRCYRIKKKDVKRYLEQRAIFPDAYSAPEGWYCEGHKRSPKEMPSDVVCDCREFYEEKLLVFKSDVLTSIQIRDFTGYGHTAVNRWCRLRKIRCFESNSKYMVPKIFLIDFLVSIHFRAINQKSQKHIKLLKEYANWRIARLSKENPPDTIKAKECE